MTSSYDKWLIRKSGNLGRWWVFPPVGSFWGRLTDHPTFEEAVADFRRQTSLTWQPIDYSDWNQ